MNFFDYIREWFINATQFFVNLALESYYSWYIPDVMGDMFGALSTFTSRVAGYLWDASNWYDWLAYQITTFLSQWDLEAWFLPWKQTILDAWNWVYNAFWNVTSIVNNWWLSTKATVQGWIDVAKQFLQVQINSANTWLAGLQSAWDSFKGRIPSIDVVLQWFTNWWGNTLANVISWGALTGLQIDSLIGSWFKNYEPFWAGWQEVYLKFKEFFDDPEKWLMDKLESMLARFI